MKVYVIVFQNRLHSAYADKAAADAYAKAANDELQGNPYRVVPVDVQGAMTVHVIMGNDCPHSVYAEQEAADAFVEGQDAERKRLSDEYRKTFQGTPPRRIHWRIVSLTLQQGKEP